MIKMAKRIVYLDVAKALAMFLVVFGHIIVEYDTREYNAPAALYIYTFHTALFMFLSGFFFQSCLSKTIKSLFFEKTRQLLIPYLCWWVVYLFVIEIPESGFDVSGCVSTFLRGGVLKGYWYVKLLFVYIIGTYLLIKLFRNKWIGSVAAYLLFTILPNFSFSRIFIPFFLAGFLGRGLIEKAKSWWWIVGLLVVDIVLYSFWQNGYNYISLSMKPVPYLVRTGIGIVTSFFIILLLKKLSEYVPENNKIVRSIAYSGTITLGIYLCHNFYFRDILWGWLLAPLPKNILLIYFVFAIVVYIITSSFITLLGKNRYLSFLFLGTRLKNKNQNN